ncbi:MAG: TolB family protein, partial [Stackebrandtia sp.]
ASDGSQGNNHSFEAVVSADGRYVAFVSFADNVVTGDTNGWEDVFVHDRRTGDTSRVSVAGDGSQANGSSHDGVVSADGRYIAFQSFADNLVPGDTNGVEDVFVHDRQTGVTSRVSVTSSGSQVKSNSPGLGLAIAADGRYVAFASSASRLVPGDTNGAYDVFVHDRQTGATRRVSIAGDGSQANSASVGAAISADGRHVAFISRAGNLVPGDTNRIDDVLVRIVR